jgi:hypothetical protein
MVELELPTLSAAMGLSGPRGMCFHRSIALCLDLPMSELIVATLRAATAEERAKHPEYSDVPFFHAWVEWQGNLLAPTTIELRGGQLLPMNPQEYYALNGVTDIKRLTREFVEDFCDNLILNHLRYGHRVPHGYVVDRLFGAIRTRYKLSDRGGVIPL